MGYAEQVGGFGEVAVGMVVGTTFLDAQEMLEVVNHARSQFFHRNVFNILIVD